MKKALHKLLSIDIAGPGSGKTTSLIGSVKAYERTNDLRDVAVITYTNFARDKIEEGLFKEGVANDEVFIGTIHSFLIRYVISPFAHKYEEDYPSDLKYAEVKTSHLKNPAAKASYINSLMKKGVIPYGKVESFARRLLKNKEVAQAVAGKLQAVFVDEYQDATTTHHAIFEALIKAGLNRFYCVGDSEQYIYGFTYQGRSRPVFGNIPMNILANETVFEKKFLNTNWRSGANIINFLNMFVDDHRKQAPDPDRDDQGSVIFVQSTNMKDALQIASSSKSDDETMMVLAYAGTTLQGDEFASVPMGARDSSMEYRTITGIVTEYICNFLRCSKRAILDKEAIDEIEFRGKVVEIADQIDKNPAFELKDTTALIKALFPVTSKSNYALDFTTPDEYLYMAHAIRLRDTDNKQVIKMTIHKAKGLEADVVLVVASTNNELAKWLNVDLDARSADSNDTCRVGFVAFSRARRNLYIACKEGINEDNKKTLLALGAKGI